MFDWLVEWAVTKDWLAAELGLTHAMLHVHLGLLLFLLASAILRRPFGDWRPLAIVAGLEAINELLDFLRYAISGWPWSAGPTIEDLVNTLLWPTMIVLVARGVRERLNVSP